MPAGSPQVGEVWLSQSLDPALREQVLVLDISPIRVQIVSRHGFKRMVPRQSWDLSWWFHEDASSPEPCVECGRDAHLYAWVKSPEGDIATSFCGNCIPQGTPLYFPTDSLTGTQQPKWSCPNCSSSNTQSDKHLRLGRGQRTLLWKCSDCDNSWVLLLCEGPEDEVFAESVERLLKDHSVRAIIAGGLASRNLTRKKVDNVCEQNNIASNLAAFFLQEVTRYPDIGSTWGLGGSRTHGRVVVLEAAGDFVTIASVAESLPQLRHIPKDKFWRDYHRIPLRQTSDRPLLGLPLVVGGFWRRIDDPSQTVQVLKLAIDENTEPTVYFQQIGKPHGDLHANHFRELYERALGPFEGRHVYDSKVVHIDRSPEGYYQVQDINTKEVLFEERDALTLLSRCRDARHTTESEHDIWKDPDSGNLFLEVAILKVSSPNLSFAVLKPVGSYDRAADVILPCDELRNFAKVDLLVGSFVRDKAGQSYRLDSVDKLGQRTTITYQGTPKFLSFEELLTHYDMVEPNDFWGLLNEG